MGNLKPRRPMATVTARQTRDPRMVLERLHRIGTEDKAQAIARAMTRPWWPRVWNRTPGLSGDGTLWVWQVRP